MRRVEPLARAWRHLEVSRLESPHASATAPSALEKAALPLRLFPRETNCCGIAPGCGALTPSSPARPAWLAYGAIPTRRGGVGHHPGISNDGGGVDDGQADGHERATAGAWGLQAARLERGRHGHKRAAAGAWGLRAACLECGRH